MAIIAVLMQHSSHGYVHLARQSAIDRRLGVAHAMRFPETDRAGEAVHSAPLAKDVRHAASSAMGLVVRLRVYDTINTGVVDASIFPIEPPSHVQSTVYAAAEKLQIRSRQTGDLIKIDSAERI